MSSRQSANAASSSGQQYAAPATFAVAQLDILYSNETSNPANTGQTNGTGSSAGATRILPIQPVSNAVATPSSVYGSTGAAVGNNGLTSSGTTATCLLGHPHGFVVGATGVTATVNTALTSYNVTNASVTITGPYSFTYTTTGSNLGASGGGFVTMPIPNAAGTAVVATGQPFSPAVQGATIRGATVGTLEYWADQTVWDTSNNRPIYQGLDFDPAVQYKSS